MYKRMAQALDRWTYAAVQAGRVAFFTGQYIVARRRALDALDEQDDYVPKGGFPGRQGMLEALREVFQRDWANVQAGVYPMPLPLAGPGRALRTTRSYLGDIEAITERRRRRGMFDVRREAEVGEGDYPGYYLQNFHYQTGGWLSEDSAAVYDHQVEVLFTGSADAMRRMALPPLKARLAETPARPRVLDVAAGTGRFLYWLKRALPRARVTALDLSAAYLARVPEHVPSARTVQAPAEAMPFAEGVFDAVTCVYLFHELPPKVRPQVAQEIARVLRPGGRAVIVDALQTGDRPDFDGLLEMFPRRFHEPYFTSYLDTDLPALFQPLTLVSAQPAFLSKVFVFDKPA
ncbi:MAG: methyltransferase domain-containing protein [Rhodothalassiaceae bacterium]